MLSSRSQVAGAFARLLALTMLLAAATLGLVTDARAAVAPTRGTPTARLGLAPDAQSVSGLIVFRAMNVGPGARTVIYMIDGHRVWTARSAPYRYQHTGRLDTRTLRNGRHALGVVVVYKGGRLRAAQRRITVHNTPRLAVHKTPGPAVHKTPRPNPIVQAAPAPPATPTDPVDVGVSGPPAGGGGTTVALFNRETFAYSSQLSVAQEANRYQVIALQYTDAALVPMLHAANPGLKILLYQDALLGRSGDPLGWTACSDYPDVAANHPDWFLKDQNGNRIEDASYPTNYVMDVGNPAYQQACLAHATQMAKQKAFDGIYFDDVTANVTWTFPAGITSPQYPTPSSWQAAMQSMITYAAGQAHAQGLLLLGNIGGAVTTPGLWEQWNAPMDGAEEQQWNDTNTPLAQQIRDWPARLAEVTASEARNKLLVLQSYATTEAGNTFGLASMMLAANGHTSYSTSNANLTSDEAWYPEYDTAQQLGAPAGGYKTLANGVYERAFSNGIVLVNPSASATSAFSLGGGQYSGTGLANATRASLGPMSALILLKVG
jgi:hypothetical protein